jgi:hypothetical protein
MTMTDLAPDAPAPDAGSAPAGDAVSLPPAPATLREASDIVPVDLDAPLEPQIKEAAERAEQDAETEDAEKARLEARPADYPRSWANNSVGVKLWNSLPPEIKAQINSRDAESSGAASRRQQELAKRGKEADAKVHAFIENATANMVAGEEFRALQNIKQVIEKSGIKTEADFAKLQAEQPEEAEAFRQLVAEHQRLVPVVAMKLQAHQSAQREQEAQTRERVQAAWKQYTDGEDQKFQEKIPEFADPERYEALQDASMDALVELGFDEEALEKEWRSNPLLRDHRVQLLLAEVGRNRLARLKAAQARPKQPPPPQRSGVGRDAAPSSDLASAANRGDMEAFIAMRKKGANR